MSSKLDPIHHIAITVDDISKAVAWYRNQFQCEIDYQDDSWASLKFANIHLALVLPGAHPSHIGIPCLQPELFGTPHTHRDGTSSAYITDPFGNYIEMIKLNN